MTRHQDPQDELADEFVVSPLPPIGKDGAPELQPMRRLPVHHPRLCEAGPCVHYHRMVLQMDVQSPMARRGPDGALESQEAAFHPQTHHYCYPDVGIETRLGDLPILECNRWSPITPAKRMFDDSIAEGFWQSDDGQRHQASIAAWRADRAREAQVAASSEAQAAADLAAMPSATPPTVGLMLSINEGVPRSIRCEWGATIGSLIETETGAMGLSSSDGWIIKNRKGALLSNRLDATVSQLGLTEGDYIHMSRKDRP